MQKFDSKFYRQKFLQQNMLHYTYLLIIDSQRGNTSQQIESKLLYCEATEMIGWDHFL